MDWAADVLERFRFSHECVTCSHVSVYRPLLACCHAFVIHVKHKTLYVVTLCLLMDMLTQLLVHCDRNRCNTVFLELNLLNTFIANVGKSVFVYLLLVISSKTRYR